MRVKREEETRDPGASCRDNGGRCGVSVRRRRGGGRRSGWAHASVKALAGGWSRGKGEREREKEGERVRVVMAVGF